MSVDGRTLLAWADLDERRRRSGRAMSTTIIAIGLGLVIAAAIGYRDAWWRGIDTAPSAGALLAIALSGALPAMLAAPHRMFWRSDAAMIARLPIPGASLWRVAVVRAGRSAAVGALVPVPLLALTAIVDLPLALRAAGLVVTLAIVATTLVPAACVGAAHAVASGQAAAATQALAGDYAVATTTWLGAIPGATISAVVIASVATGDWISTGDGMRGPVVLAVMVAVAVAAAAVATWIAPQVYPRAMREVAALDRQILAHIEIDPPTAIERRVRERLDVDAGRAFDRMVRLVRRRYPLFALAGAAGAIAIVAVSWAQPNDADLWLAIAIGAMAAVAVLLAQATGRDPIELARVSATAAIAPSAIVRARRAVVGLWLAVWLAIPTTIAIARSANVGRTVAILAGSAAMAALLVSARRGPAR